MFVMCFLQEVLEAPRHEPEGDGEEAHGDDAHDARDPPAEEAVVADGTLAGEVQHRHPWLRTNGVNANGAAAKVYVWGGLEKRVCPGNFGNIKVG